MLRSIYLVNIVLVRQAYFLSSFTILLSFADKEICPDTTEEGENVACIILNSCFIAVRILYSYNNYIIHQILYLKN